jgi:drug/metabolite transporter (DMT)-like permease
MRRPPTAREALGLACGLVGVVLVERPRLDGDHLAALVALLSSVSTAVAMLGLHRLREIDTRAVVAHFAGTASLVSVAWFLSRGGVLTSARPDPITALMLLGVGATGTVGQFFLTRAYAAGVPTRVSVLALSQVVFAMILDAVLWGTTMTAVTLLGACLILAPSAWLMLGGGRRAAGADDDAE